MKYATAPVPPCTAQGEADKADKPPWIRYPGEDFNLLGDRDPANDPPPEVLNELRASLEAAHTCAGSACP